MAAQAGHEAVVRLLLEQRADANAAHEVPLAGAGVLCIGGCAGAGLGARLVGQARPWLAAAEAKDPRRLGPTAVERLTSGCVFDQWSKFGPRVVCRSSESFEGLEGGIARGVWQCRHGQGESDEGRRRDEGDPDGT